MINDMLHQGSSDSIENQNGLKEIEREKDTSSSKTHESVSPPGIKLTTQKLSISFNGLEKCENLPKLCLKSENEVVPATAVESDHGKYPSLSETWYNEMRECSAVRPSFARTAADKFAEVGAMMSRRPVSSQRKLIVRPKTLEDPRQATDGDEEILEEEAVCKFCFAKLNSEDMTLMTRCGCRRVLIHEKCIASWCRVIYDSNDKCGMCNKEVQKLPIILITHLIPVESKGSKWSWSSCFKGKKKR